MQIQILPQTPIRLSVTSPTMTRLNVGGGSPIRLNVIQSATFVGGASTIVGTANEIDVVTAGGTSTVSLATNIVTPNNLDVTGQLEVDGQSFFFDDVTVDTGKALVADVGGDLQGALPNPTVHRLQGIDIHNSPDNLDLFQYKTSNNKIHWVTFAEAGVAAASHTHALSDLTQSSAEQYMVPQWNGTNWVPVDTIGSVNRISCSSEMNAAAEFTVYGSGTGTANSFNSVGLDYSGHFGILNSSTGTTNAGRAGIGTALETDNIELGIFNTDTTSILSIPTLSTSTERFYVHHGFNDNRLGTPTDAVMFYYKDDVNGGRWQCQVINNNTVYSADSGITVVAGTWYKLRITVDQLFARFYINGTLVHTSSPTQIPTGSSRRLGLSVGITKTVGTTARNVHIDYMNFIQDTAR